MPHQLALPAHDGPVLALAFAPDGAVLASGGADGALHLHPRDAVRPAPALLRFEDELRALVFAGRRTVVAGPGSSLHAIHIDERGTQRSPLRHDATTPIDGRVLCLAAVTGDTVLAGTRRAAFGTLYRWHIDRAPESVHNGDGWLRALATGAERHIVAAHRSGDTVVFQLGNPAPRLPFEHSRQQTAVAMRGRTVLGAGEDTRLRQWWLPHGTEQARARVLHDGGGEWIWCVAIAPDGRFAVAGDGGGRVVTIDLSSGQRRRLLTADAPVRCVAISPDSRCIAAGDDTGNIWWLDPDAGTPLPPYDEEAATQ